MSQGTRRVRFDNFVDYIQKNYRVHLNAMDYEMLKTIADTYNTDEIMRAIEYSKSRGSDSLIYLQDALKNKYYQTTIKAGTEPVWFKEETKKEPLDEEDKEWARSFYYKYCDSKEEAEKKIKELDLEKSK